MGRHSAPDDDDELSTAELPSEFDAGIGRHQTVLDELDISPAEPAHPTSDAGPDAAGGTRTDPPRDTGTHADLRMLREHPALRARCAAAVVVPFLLYTATLVIIGRADVYLLWVWIPTVTAGVLVGTFLDAAHRRERRAKAAAD